jgi:hypothetical protein
LAAGFPRKAGVDNLIAVLDAICGVVKMKAGNRCSREDVVVLGEVTDGPEQAGGDNLGARFRAQLDPP